MPIARADDAGAVWVQWPGPPEGPVYRLTEDGEVSTRFQEPPVELAEFVHVDTATEEVLYLLQDVEMTKPVRMRIADALDVTWEQVGKATVRKRKTDDG